MGLDTAATRSEQVKRAAASIAERYRRKCADDLFGLITGGSAIGAGETWGGIRSARGMIRAGTEGYGTINR